MPWQEEAQRYQAGRDHELICWNSHSGIGVVKLLVGQAKTKPKEEVFYLVELHPLQDYLAGTVRPLGEQHGYSVTISADPRKSSCECLGYINNGYCRHLIALCELYRQGKLLPNPEVIPCRS